MMSLRSSNAWAAILALSIAAAWGCRGDPSSKPPVHLNRNMDTQDKYRPQRASTFFEDGRAMRTPPAGTVPHGQARTDDSFYRGQTPEGAFVTALPVKVDGALLKRGQERFNIYCAPCHDRSGYGKGAVTQRPGLVPIPSYHDPRIVALPVGQLFDVITNGVRTMPSYRHQIPVEDRWAIVAYVRALQRSQNARLEDVPEDQREALR